MPGTSTQRTESLVPSERRRARSGDAEGSPQILVVFFLVNQKEEGDCFAVLCWHSELTELCLAWNGSG